MNNHSSHLSMETLDLAISYGVHILAKTSGKQSIGIVVDWYIEEAEIIRTLRLNKRNNQM